MEGNRTNRLLQCLLIAWLCFFVTVVMLSHFMADLAFAFYAGLPLCILWLVLAGASVALCGQFISQRRWLLSLLVVLLPLLVPTVARRTAWFWQDVTDIAHFLRCAPNTTLRWRACPIAARAFTNGTGVGFSLLLAA